jgi:type IV pilus assembly protein PilV
MKKINQFAMLSQTARKQKGIMVLEAMMAILIFSLGILAMMALQAAAIRLSGDAKGRIDASFLADKLISQMWLADPLTLNTFSHNSTATANPCLPNGGGPNNPVVANWLTNDVLPNLPGGNTVANFRNYQRVTVTGNVVQVSLCWQTPGDTTFHNYLVTSAVIKNPPPVFTP